MADDDSAYLSSLSAHPNRAGDTSNLNPNFAGNLAAAIREARANGLTVGVESGYRNPQELVSQGASGPAARFDAAGNSLHSYGLASDVSGLGSANSQQAQQWAAIAAKHSLYNPYGIGDKAEFNHWQAYPFTLDQRPDVHDALAKASATGNFQNVWNAGNAYLSGGSAVASAAQGPGAPARPVTTAPGVTLNSSPMDLVANLESGNRNIPQQIVDKNTAKGTPAGGYFQIIDPTWRTYAGAAGVDLKAYPTAMSAPRAVQAQVASAIPVNQWGPNTVAALKARYPSIDTSQTLGAVQSAALGGALSAPASTTAVASAGGGQILPGFGTAQASNQFLQNLDKFDKSVGGGGLNPDQQGQGQGQAQPNIQPSPMMPGPGLRNAPGPAGVEAAARQLEPRLTGYSPQPYGQTLNSDPLAWAGGSPQQPDWLRNAGLQQAAQASPYGTSIGSMQMAFGVSPQQLSMLMSPWALSQAQSGGGYA